MVSRSVSLLCVAAVGASGCFLFDDPYEPCSSLEGTGTPVPGPTPGQDPVPTGPLPDDANGASGDRYRRASNGLICRCGTNEIGCFDTPDAALKDSVCRPSPLGPEYEANCQPEGVPGATSLPPETSAPVLKWSCPYKWRKRYTDDAWLNETRIRQAQNYNKANWSHFQWCLQKSDNSWEFVCSDCATTPVP